MKSIRSWLKCLAIGVALLTSAAPIRAQFIVPSGIEYQGLIEQDGKPLVGGTQVDIYFRDPLNITTIYTQTLRNVMFVDGIYKVVLGNPLPNMSFDSVAIQLVINGTNTLPPIRMWGAPYALNTARLGNFNVAATPVAGSIFVVPVGTGYNGSVKIDPAFLPPIPTNLLREPPLRSINSVSADTSHDIQFISGSNMTVTPNNGGHSITLSTTSSLITSVRAGAGLQMSGSGTNVILSVAPGGISSNMLASTLQIGSSTSTSTALTDVAAEVSGGSAVMMKGGIGANNPTGSADGTGLSPGSPQTFWSDQVSVPSTTTTSLTIYNTLINTSSTIVLLPMGSSSAVSNLVITSQPNGSFIVGSSTNMGTGVGGSVTAINYMVVNH